ncbi:MAG: TonB-dependent receptor plug domain-containing protein, partial [Janthinobacterium lividum]
MNVVTNHRISAPMLRRTLLGMLSATPLMLIILGSSAEPVFAQVVPTGSAAEAKEPAAKDEDLVVTGTRVVRDGYRAPTPVTVVSVEQLQTVAASSVADALNLLPQFSGSSTPQSTAGGINNHQGGINGVSLRGLGTIRTLVLLNGQRIVGDISTGVVDVNQLPEQLIKRVDTVFGGASAEYGSDALTGVVNFVLDNKFTGLKGEVSGGVTTYGDDRDWKVALTAGTSFASGRGHIVVSGEAARNDGILSPNTRSWNLKGSMMMNNPAYGTAAGQSTSVPQYIARDQVGMSNAAPGGLITSGPLKGTLFGAGGAISMINYGSIISNPLMSGGDWEATNEARVFAYALDPEQSRQNVFARISYDITDDIDIYGQAQYAHSTEVSNSVANYRTGDITVRSDNPLIPTAIAQSMAAQGLTSFQMGTMNLDLGGTTPTYDRSVARYLVGGDATFDALGTTWKSDLHASYGRHEGYSAAINSYKPANYALAIDVVRSPTTGAIVCRSTLTNPGNGCVPYNLFGTGVNSLAAIKYVEGGEPYYNEVYTQKVVGANISGEPLTLWAGPISIATGFEYRKEETHADADAGEALNQWFITSGTPFAGQFSVIEGYVATVIPLAKGTFWAKSLEVSGAVRVTNYSTFGTKMTWKVGLNYSPIDDLRFRGNLSRDLREPTMVDLYSAPVGSSLQIADPFLNNVSVNYQGFTVGNPELKPESALSLGLGAVYQPH